VGINCGQCPSGSGAQGIGPAGQLWFDLAAPPSRVPLAILIVGPRSPRPADVHRVSAVVTGVSGSTGQDGSMSEKAIRTPPVARPKMLGNRAAASGVATAALPCRNRGNTSRPSGTAGSASRLPSARPWTSRSWSAPAGPWPAQPGRRRSRSRRRPGRWDCRK